MLKKIIIFSIMFFATFSKEVNAQFSDEFINPFLGIYKIDKSHVGVCPDDLILMAECTLDQLDLKSPKNPDFDYVIFEGINSGEMRTTLNNKLVKTSLTTLKDLKITSKRSSYMRNYKTWFNETVELELGAKKFSLKKSQLDRTNKNSQITLQCDYVFNVDENKKVMEEFNKTRP